MENDAFIEKFGSDIFDALFEELYNQISGHPQSDKRFHFSSIDNRSSPGNSFIYYRFEVYYEDRGIVCYITGEDGNSNGSVILNFEIESESDEERLEKLLKISSEDFWGIAG